MCPKNPHICLVSDRQRTKQRNTLGSRSQRKEAVSMAHSFILAVSHDPMILETRTSVMQSAGYHVEAVQSVSKAFDRFRNEQFDLVVLCHSIPPRERDQLTVAIRASGARTPVLTVSPFSDIQGFADAVVESSPKKLLEGIKAALHRTIKQCKGAEIPIHLARCRARPTLHRGLPRQMHVQSKH